MSFSGPDLWARLVGRSSGVDRGRSRAGLKILIPGYAQWSWHQHGAGAGAVRLVPGGAGCRSLFLGNTGRAGGAGVCVWDARRLGHRHHPAGGVSRVRPMGRRCYRPPAGWALGSTALRWPWRVWSPGQEWGMARPGKDTWSTAVPTARPRQNMVIGFGFGRRPGAKAGSGGSWPGRVRRSNGRTSNSGSKASCGLPGVSWLPRQFPADLVLIVPGDHALIAPVSSGSARTVPGTPVLVPCGEILGRAWARYYPIRERQLLK